MELAVVNERQEIFKMLTEVTEITDKVKLIQMSVLIKSGINGFHTKRSKIEFQGLLETLPVDLVRNAFWKYPISFASLGEHHKCARAWDTFANCCS